MKKLLDCLPIGFQSEKSHFERIENKKTIRCIRMAFFVSSVFFFRRPMDSLDIGFYNFQDSLL